MYNEVDYDDFEDGEKDISSIQEEWDSISRQEGNPLVLNVGKYTLLFIIINVIVFILNIFYPMSRLFAMNFHFRYEIWRWFTSLFFHFSTTHLLFNMISLFLFGNIIEHRLGSKSFLMVYFLSGFAGNIGFLLISAPTTFGAGASGSIFGLIGAATLLFPNLLLYINFLPLPLKVAGPLMALGELILLFGEADGIGHSAHFFGFVAGIMLAFYFRRKEIEHNKNYPTRAE